MSFFYRKLINTYIVGISEEVSNTELDKISDLWARFHKENISKKIPYRITGGIYCAYYKYESDHTGKYRMLIGHEVKQPLELYAGLDYIQVPDLKYGVYHSIGNQPKTLMQTWKDIWNDKNIDRAYALDFDFYPADNTEHVITFVSMNKAQ